MRRRLAFRYCCGGYQLACVSVSVMIACATVATGPLNMLSTYANMAPNRSCVDKRSGTLSRSQPERRRRAAVGGCTRRAEEVERVEARDAADDKRAGGRNARRGCELVQLGGGVRLACVGAASASVNSRGHAVGVRRAAT